MLNAMVMMFHNFGGSVLRDAVGKMKREKLFGTARCFGKLDSKVEEFVAKIVFSGATFRSSL